MNYFSFLAARIPWLLDCDSMIPMEPAPPMHPFAIVVIFFREMGGLLAGPPVPE